MAFKKLTETGKEFIRNVGTVATRDNGDTSLLSGNNGVLPYSDKKNDPNIVWTANIVDIRNNNPITNNSKYVEYLIYLFDKYAKEYEMDANIIAAQAYQESRYKAWIYVKKIVVNGKRYDSTASSISQIVMNTMYDAIYRFKFLTDSEISLITNGMTNPSAKSSWRRVLKPRELTAKNYETQEANRSILHQNMIDNTHLCIKIQCGIMDYIAGNNANLASSCLFAYNRGSELTSSNYINLINKTSKSVTNGNEYIKEGVKYVEEIFGYLGDKDNQYVKTLDDSTKGYWFGYKLDLDKNNYNEFDANVKSGLPNESTRSLSALQLDFREAYLAAKTIFEEKYANQYSIGVSSTYRSIEEQKQLYRKGRNSRGEVIDRSKIVTNVDGIRNLSRHNYLKSKGLDFFVFDEQTRKIDWDTVSLYEEFARLVQSQLSTVTWGGDFTSINDYPHLQVPTTA